MSDSIMRGISQVFSALQNQKRGFALGGPVSRYFDEDELERQRRARRRESEGLSALPYWMRMMQGQDAVTDNDEAARRRANHERNVNMTLDDAFAYHDADTGPLSKGMKKAVGWMAASISPMPGTNRFMQELMNSEERHHFNVMRAARNEGLIPEDTTDEDLRKMAQAYGRVNPMGGMNIDYSGNSFTAPTDMQAALAQAGMVQQQDQDRTPGGFSIGPSMAGPTYTSGTNYFASPSHALHARLTDDRDDNDDFSTNPTDNDYFGRTVYQKGGQVQQQTQVVEAAQAALAGQHPEPEMAIDQFVEMFGREALMAMIQQMQGGEGRTIEGPGDGMSDSVPMMIDGVEEARASSGEYIVPADAVADLGNGDSDAGSQQLDQMIARLRQAKHGTTQQPPAVNPQKVMPV